MTLGDVRVTGINPKHLSLVLDKLRSAGARISFEPEGFASCSPSARAR